MNSSTRAAMLAAAALSAVPPAHASAEPWIALKTGLKCSACHVNRSGGGARNDFGSLYAQTRLTWAPGELKSRALTEFLFVGLDFRLKASGTLRESSPRTAIDLDEAQAYLEARLLRERVALYIDQTLGPNRAVARELFALIEKLPWNGYAKAGKLLPRYGLRLKDDEEFVRAVTGFNYDTPDQGLEIGVEPPFLTSSGPSAQPMVKKTRHHGVSVKELGSLPPGDRSSPSPKTLGGPHARSPDRKCRRPYLRRHDLRAAARPGEREDGDEGAPQ